jgi:predicted dehydrogenase
MTRGGRGAGRGRAQVGPPLGSGERPVTVSIAVIGAGYMGTNHARVVSSLPGARLAVIVHSDAAKARAVAAEFGSAHATSIDDLDGEVNAAIVATPTETHRSIAIDALARG